MQNTSMVKVSIWLRFRVRVRLGLVLSTGVASIFSGGALSS